MSHSSRPHDLSAVVDDPDAAGLLARVASPVDPVHELAGAGATFEGQRRAVLFEDVRGHDVPVLMGLYWSREVLAHVLRRPEPELSAHVTGCVREWQRAPVPPVVVGAGPVREVTVSGDDVDLSRIPVPTHALGDGGPYIDAGVVPARDPDTGGRNLSIQRFMVAGPRTLHVSIDAGRHLVSRQGGGPRGAARPQCQHRGRPRPPRKTARERAGIIGRSRRDPDRARRRVRRPGSGKHEERRRTGPAPAAAS
jgi:3-polyprenyl-4-hydroxybenzoate decarboxylase